MTIASNPVDALLAIRDGDDTARWNFVDAVGSLVSAPAGLGNAATVSVSFPSTQPAYDGEPGFRALTASQRAAAQKVLGLVSDVARISFVETSGIGKITYAFSAQGNGSGGFAYFPAFNTSFDAESGVLQTVSALDVAGDVHLNGDVFDAASDFSPGSYGFGTLLHETGHALGLKHPFEATVGSVLDGALDDLRHTVMSYTDAPFTTLLVVTGTAQSYSWREFTLEPRTLMPLDIAALQVLYGANLGTRSGNDTYTWGANEEFLETIWDGGGKDTIDCANQTLPCRVDLESGQYSSIGLRLTTATLRSALDIPAFFDDADLPVDLYNGADNLAIAAGVTIENATGGSANDELLGNAVANVLDGGAGRDTLAGGLGNDTYVVDRDTDVVLEGVDGGTDLVRVKCTFVLPENVEKGSIIVAGSVNLTGNGSANTLESGAGDNLLDGGDGVDIVSYRLATAGVTVSLATQDRQTTGGSGLDLLQQIEGLSGSAFNDKLVGSSGDNLLTGGNGNDTLSGGGGRDTLAGGLGKDTLTGGGGADIFRFDTALNATTNVDSVTDFKHGTDVLQLENGIFKALTATGTLAAGSFRSGAGVASAADANDFLIYNTTSGALFYDADGAGGAAAVKLVALTTRPALTAADFLVT